MIARIPTGFNDTIAAGEIRCWAPPDIAVKQKLLLVVNELRKEPGAQIEPWLDSLELNRSWTLRIRNSRSEPGSSEWQARWRKLHEDITRWNMGEGISPRARRAPAYPR